MTPTFELSSLAVRLMTCMASGGGGGGGTFPPFFTLKRFRFAPSMTAVKEVGLSFLFLALLLYFISRKAAKVNVPAGGPCACFKS